MTSDAKLIGHVLQERYHLTRILGRGSFGAAYLAEDTKLRRGCVVKQMLIPSERSTSQVANYQGNFEREASLLVQLNHPGHPNIPEIYDYFSDRSGNYLVMKYIEGRSLKTLLAESEGTIPWRQAVRFGIEVCQALTYMHGLGQANNNGDTPEPVIHRDIKPDNILLGNDDRVWLVDFGLAKAKPVEGAADLALTQASGSLGYSPLEQWLGEPVPASDIYALGATLHHLVTGQHPGEAFEAGFDFDKLTTQHGQFASVRDVDPSLPKALADVLSQATHPTPEQRPTAQQFKAQLEALIFGPQTAALFTFKDGQSAHTLREFVTMSELRREEAATYLQNGDFESWFRIINRNDLAEAASQSSAYPNSPQRNLDRFLRLIMPNLWLLRLGRLFQKMFKLTFSLGTLGLIVLIVAGCSIFFTLLFGLNLFTQFTVAGYDWDFSRTYLESPNLMSEDRLSAHVQNLSGALPLEQRIDAQAPDELILHASMPGIVITQTLTLTRVGNLPQLDIPKQDDGPLVRSLVEGINGGIRTAFQQSPYDLTHLAVIDEGLVYTVRPSGRAPLPERVLPLIAIFNERDNAIIVEIVEIEDERRQIAPGDSVALEVEPGRYQYRVRDADSGTVIEHGEAIWEDESYRWRIADE